MGGVSRAIAVGMVASLLAAGLGACGDGADSDSTGGQPSAKVSSGATAGEAHAQAGSRRAGGGTDADGKPEGDFQPKPHHDSGGGSQQFVHEGADNSIQEFGSEADESEMEEAALVLHNFLDARVAHAWKVACSYIGADILESLRQFAGSAKQTGCPTILAALSKVPQKALVEAAQADVGALRTEGDRGFVLYRGVKGQDFAISVTREDGEWKVAALAGSPLL